MFINYWNKLIFCFFYVYNNSQVRDLHAIFGQQIFSLYFSSIYFMQMEEEEIEGVLALRQLKLEW